MAKILVIEDEKFVRTNLVYILEAEDYEVVCAQDGLEGVESAKEHLPDLIICDIMMPRLSGYEVLAQLRTHPKTAVIPFIFLTAKGEKVDLRKGMNLGADDYITKPFEIEELLTSIKTRLEKQKELARHIDNIRLKARDILPHELSKPLTAIRGFAEILCEAKNLKINLDAITDMANSILKSENILERLVENYNFFINSTSKKDMKVWIEHKEVFTKEIITDIALQKAEKVSRENDLKFNLWDKGFLLSVNSFMKILDELLDNALKFSKPGSPIEIETSVNANIFSFVVKESGCGMKKEQIEQIAPFVQFNQERCVQEGSGLGLFVVKRLVELNNGEISIESELDKGTKITIILKAIDNKVGYSF